MLQKINDYYYEYGDHQEANDNSQAIATNLQIIELEGKLMDLIISELVQSRLDFIRCQSKLLEPFTYHFHLQDLLDLLKIGGTVNG